ncbi:hypothetical protein GE09DRAFT_1139624 [Coniochaeta sp. 2T2.1]|nr:hypothetical protein GE09DRAFT_1139624 [Coniochaeta sp. 2T2.1]
MCQETVVTYELCRHEVAERRHCAAAQREIDRAQKRVTWCCFASAPSRRIDCKVQYQTYKDYAYCGRCKILRRREQDRQVQAAREKERRRARADQVARDRTVLDRLAQNEAKSKAEKAKGVQRYGWQKVTPVESTNRPAQQRHGDSFIENPLYAEILNLLTEAEYREFMPSPESMSRMGTGTGSQHSRSQSQPLRDIGRVREHNRSRSNGPTRVPPQVPLSTKRVQEAARRNPRDQQPTATVPASVARARPQLQIAVPERQHIAVPHRQAMPNGGSGPSIVQGGGYPASARKPVPLRKDSQKHGPADAYGEPMPDDDFLDFVERYV